MIDATDTAGTVTSTLTADNITVKVGTTTVTPTTKTLSSATNITNGKQYTLTLSGFTGSGAISIVIDASTLTDPSSNANVSTSITTGLEVYTPLRGTVDNLVSSDYVGAYGAINTSDSDQTFITGTNPNNYIWYSGKLWRAVSKDTSDNSVKLVTQWAISSIPYNVSDNTAFSGSHAQMWLNDIASDGFLGTLYNYSNYIKSSSWNATLTTATTKPATTTMVTNYVGLLNIYEYYKASYTPNSTSGYLNDGLLWWTLTPYSSSNVRNVNDSGSSGSSYAYKAYGLRPSVNLKSSITITGGTGTETDPYLLAGDDTAPATNTLLNTRRSGEYITFGDGVNNLYRIVNIENSKTKIVSAIPLKSGTSYKTRAFSTSNSYVTYTNNSNYTLAYYLNNDYLNTTNGFLTSSQVSMIETNQTWYTGSVTSGANYNLGKCTTAGINCTKNAVSTTATVGLLRLGEQLAGQFDRYGNNTYYWTLTPYSSSSVWNVHSNGISDNAYARIAYGLRPSVNLKSSTRITGGKGTKKEPFTINVPLSTFNYKSYVESSGWQTPVTYGEISGTVGQSKKLAGMVINVSDTSITGGINYKGHYANVGWESSFKTSGQTSGGTDISQFLQAIQINLTGSLADKYDIYYSSQVADIGWMGWAKNGETSGTTGCNKALESFKIEIVAKGAPAPGSTASASSTC